MQQRNKQPRTHLPTSRNRGTSAAIALGLLMAAGCGDAPDDSFPLAPLPVAAESSECLVERSQGDDRAQTTFRLAEANELLADSPTAPSTKGLQPSIFFHRLDPQDRVLQFGQRVAGELAWQHTATLDERGHPVVNVYEFEGTVAGRIERKNVYDGAGRLEQTEWFNGTGNEATFTGQRAQYRYDGAGRRTREQITRPEGTTRATAWQHDASGRLATVEWFLEERTSLRITYGYSSTGRLERETIDGRYDSFAVDGSVDHTTRWAYDDRGRIRAAYAEGRLGDIVAGPTKIGYSVGCEGLRARFPAIFRQPGGPRIEPRM